MIEKLGFETDKFDESQQKLYELLQFFVRLILVGAVFHFLLWLYPDTSAYQSFLAHLLNIGLNLLGFDFTVQGTIIITPGVEYVITQDCTGWKSGMALIGLTYASTGKLRKHLKFLGSGIALIWVANYIRVVTTVVLAEKGILRFEIVHGFLWRWGLTAVVFAIWLLWYRKLQQTDDEPHSSSDEVGDD